MSKNKRGSKKIALDAGAEGFGHNPFAQLAGKAAGGEKTREEVEKPVEKVKKADKVAEEGLPSRVVIRCERKGRGGKTVTLIEGVEEMTVAAQEQLARTLRKAFGAGSAVEGGSVVLQGDQMDRLETWLEKAGVKRVVRGN